MTIRFRERPTSRAATASPYTKVLTYSLAGIGDDLVAEAYVLAATPRIYNGLFRQNISLKPQGAGMWDVEVPYGPMEKPDVGEFTVSFDTSGGTAHITQALEHILSYERDFGTAPDHSGAIGVTENGPEGTEIVVSQFAWTEHWVLPLSYASFSYALTLKALTGKVNETSFRNFQPGEVRFDGTQARASSKDPTHAALDYRFTQSDNVADAMPDFQTGIVKQGWHYIWVEYEKAEDSLSKSLVHQPKAAHVERLYKKAEFGLLGIGTAIPS